MRRWLKNRCALASLEATRGALPDWTGSLASPAPLVRKPERGRSKQSKSPRLTARGSAQIDADRSLKVPGVLDRLSLPYTTLHLS
jgi:hypothetical protein